MNSFPTEEHNIDSINFLPSLIIVWKRIGYLISFPAKLWAAFPLILYKRENNILNQTVELSHLVRLTKCLSHVASYLFHWVTRIEMCPVSSWLGLWAMYVTMEGCGCGKHTIILYVS